MACCPHSHLTPTPVEMAEEEMDRRVKGRLSAPHLWESASRRLESHSR